MMTKVPDRLSAHTEVMWRSVTAISNGKSACRRQHFAHNRHVCRY